MRPMLLLSLLLPPLFSFAADDHPRRPPFGFRNVEIFKVDSDALGLSAVDLNGDSLLDLVLANNAEATIHLLYQRQPGEIDKGEDKDESPGTSLSLKPSFNEIKSDRRFRVERFFTEKHVSSLAIGDLNGDHKPDLAYYSDPPELEVVLQGETWGANRQKYPIRDGSQSSYALGAGDLNADGRDDLALLAKGKTYLFLQSPEGALRPPVVLNNSAAEVWDCEFADLNGDGRTDLINIIPNAEEPVLVRLQGESGFGPEIGGRLRPIRSWWVAPFPPEPGAKPVPTVFTVQDNTHRVRAYRWNEKPTRSGITAPYLLALRAEGDAAQFRRLFTDVDGDGRLDLLVSYPETAQLEVRLQDEKGSLSRSATYPTLAGVNGLAVADLDGDGRREVLVTSPKEKALGVSRWQDGRLQFPDTWPLDAKPVLLAAGPLRRPEGGAAARERVFLAVQVEGKGYHCSVLSVTAPEGGGKGNLREEAKVDLQGKGAEPKDLRLLDADGDGATDILVFVPYEDPFLYKQAAGAEGDGKGDDAGARLTFTEISRSPGFGLGQLAKLEPVALTVARSPFSPPKQEEGAMDGAVLLVAAKSYVRALRLGKDGRLEVVDQVSARGANANLLAAAALNIDGEGAPEVVAVDAAASSLEVYRRGAGGAFEFADTIEIPKFELIGLETCDLDADGREDLVILGKDKLAILYARARQEGLDGVLTYTVEKKEDFGTPQDITSGDLNGDGSPDLIVSTAPRYNLLFLAPPAAAAPEAAKKSESLELALAFPIFEEKTYMTRRPTFGPRQMLVKDVDKDGLEDLLLLIHDRILLYLQDVTP